MSQGMTFRIGSFDLAKYGDDERWAKMRQFARFYAALATDFRILAYSRPYPLVEPLDRIKEMMSTAQGPRLREQIASYRRFLEQIIQSAYLKDTDYYMVLFAQKDKSPQVLANEYIMDYEHPSFGQTKVIGFPYNFSQTPASLRRPAPEHGEHSEEILLEIGYTWDDVAKLKEKEVIV